MHVSFLVNEIHGGWKPTDTRLGGTEESVVRWAKELQKRGYGVTIYDNDNRDSYIGGEDVCINVKSHDKPPRCPTLYLTNEIDADRLDLSMYDGVIWPSEWAVDNIPVNNPRKFILPHGYDDKKIKPKEKVSKQCLYASSPDRGLETLLRAWPKVYAEHPDATLIVTYGADAYDIPGVTFVGDVDEETMNELYNTSDIWCHPCNGGELYGMTGIKAQAAGCVPVVIATMALQETVRHGYFATKETYADILSLALSNQSGKTDYYRELLSKEHYPTWQDSTDRLEEIIMSVV